MGNVAICVVNRDMIWGRAFLKTVALDHFGFSVRLRETCREDGGSADCGDVDVCALFEEDAENVRKMCPKAFRPACGAYGGVSAILKECLAFVMELGIREGGCAAAFEASKPQVFRDGALVCVYSCAGGIGTSCAAIGICRELSRYRGERVLYLSLEDAEDEGLFPRGISAMRAEDALYRYWRIESGGGTEESYEKLFSAAAAQDEYGVFRLAPDAEIGRLAMLAPDELYLFLLRLSEALKVNRIVLDFGTSLGQLSSFALLFGAEDRSFVEIIPDDDYGAKKRREFLDTDIITAKFPVCPEDVRKADGYTDIGLSNAFGLAVKEICDRLAEGAR